MTFSVDILDSLKVRLFPHAGASDVLAMEAERDMLWHDRPAQLLECSGIESEQERRSILPVKDDSEDHTFVFARCARRPHEHRFPGMRSVRQAGSTTRHSQPSTPQWKGVNMRLAILDNGHRFKTRILFAGMRAVSRLPVPDAVKVNRYRPDFYGLPMRVLTQNAMRGPVSVVSWRP
jgi:hypothetical protein